MTSGAKQRNRRKGEKGRDRKRREDEEWERGRSKQVLGSRDTDSERWDRQEAICRSSGQPTKTSQERLVIYSWSMRGLH